MASLIRKAQPSAGHRANRGTWFFWVCALLVAYGSLYPFQYASPVSLELAWDKFIAERTLWSSPGDVAGNIVLCIPLGLFAGSLCAPGVGRRWKLAAVIACCILYAFAIQVLQIFFPPRVPSVGDAVWNSAGLGLGVALRALVDGAVPFDVSGRRIDLWSLALIAAWTVTQLAPWVPSLDWQLIKDGLKPLLIAPAFDATKAFHSFAKVMAIGYLLAAIDDRSRSRAGQLALLLVVVLAGKLLVAGQGWSLANVGGFVGGYLVWQVLIARSKRTGPAFVLFALFASYTVAELAPFEWRTVPSTFHWIPFESLLGGAMDANFWALVDAFFVFGSMLWLVREIGGAVWPCAFALALWVGCAEAAQTWIVGRTADITPSLLVLLLGYALRPPARGRTPRARRQLA